MSDKEEPHLDSSDSWQPEDNCCDAPAQRISHETSMPENSKRRVDLATAGEGMSGSRCLIENTDGVNYVHYTHCLARGTKDHILDALEFSWGMPHRTLDLDTPCNVFRLGSKFHALYSKKPPMFMFLPIIQQYYNARNDRSKFPSINEPDYKYHFLAHKDMVSVPIHRLTLHGNPAAAPPAAAYTFFAHPYATFGPVTSHIHPRFVICDAGRKIGRSFTRSFALSKLYRNHARALEMVAEIWMAWTSLEDNPDFIAFSGKPDTGDKMSSTSNRTPMRRVFESIKKRRGDHNQSPLRASKRPKKG